ncbi:ADP-ribosylglycohydrolase family protein [Tenacibaculum sp. 190524A05c]|uniref:ADP-ribosyl-(Dinitrogen reductase) hydrolase n=1 Tax=Tenacibaculum platacis TaxID=3137852 RepID=A0ABM9P146_9FLAO
MKKKIEAMFLGLALGDALGVPVEFKSREALKKDPVKSMLGYGTYNQKEGTWSDDSSLTFCLAESLLNGYNLKDISSKFINWKSGIVWTPHGVVFDIGIQTSKSINNLFWILKNKKEEELTLLKYEQDEFTNGNGALMRILPLLFFIKGKEISSQFDIIRDVAALTHGHIRSAISCLIYLKFNEFLLEGDSIEKAYLQTKRVIKKFFIDANISERETSKFQRLIFDDISKYPENEIQSTGYVIHTLEASFWCLLNTKSYLESVFKAINLGEDTDTTATVVGGVSGLYYGLNDVPEGWLKNLARVDDIKKLAEDFSKKYES